MFQTSIRRDSYAVKPFWTTAYVPKNPVDIMGDQHHLSADDIMRFFEELYLFSVSIDKRTYSLKIDSEAPIDSAIFILCEFLWTNHSIEVSLEGEIQMGIPLYSNWNFSSIPGRAFYAERKNKEFFTFLMEIVSSLKFLKHSVYNNYYYDMTADNIGDMVEQTQDDFKQNFNELESLLHYKHCQMIVEKLLKFLISHIKDELTIHKKSVIKHWKNERPEWAVFIQKATDVIADQMVFTDMVPMNLNYENSNEGSVGIDDILFFAWSGDSPINDEIYGNLEMTANEFPIAEPHMFIAHKKNKMTLKQIAEKADKYEKIIALYNYNYECFRNH